jgi:N-glycosylase/DNA lyase
MHIPTLEGEIQRLYENIAARVVKRFAEFSMVWKRRDEEELLYELFFCLLTPAARAHAAAEALERLKKKGLILRKDGTAPLRQLQDRISRELNTVRFKNNKARNLIEAEMCFMGEGKASMSKRLEKFQNNHETRVWLAANLRGMGYKEASHFLRNIGLYEDIAILDRHVLRNLARFGIINAVPEGLSAKRYIYLEDEMRKLSQRIGLPLHHLDMVFWYRETGEIFK